MVIAHLIGGLGNQMFQYAKGRAISCEMGVPLYLDIQDFEGYGLHNGFELNRIFKLDLNIATQREIRHVLGWRALSPVRKKLFHERFNKFRGKNLFVESLNNYRCHLDGITSSCYLKGYWQSERYFKKILNIIHSDFTFKQEFSGHNKEIAELIKKSNAISLHIRRGDYVSNPAALAVHGTCSLNYYQRSINYLAAKISNPVFFIFSDDINWAKENIHVKYQSHYIGHNKGLDSFNDMHLMSLCDHHIIANSSFSWWGAWLNSSLDKIVVAPKQWFVADIQSVDIVPTSWVRL